MATVSANQIGDLAVVDGSRETLVVVCVAREVSMGPDARLLANRVKVSQHQGASAVDGARRVRRMVGNKDHRLLRILGLCQGGLKKGQLLIVDRRALVSLARDHTRIFEHVAIEADDCDKWNVESEVHTGLRHGCANESA